MTTLSEIYDNYTPGSVGFAAEIETHCGYETDRAVLMAIGEVASTPGEFDRIWNAPSGNEAADVAQRAWENACADQDEMFWGAEILRR